MSEPFSAKAYVDLTSAEKHVFMCVMTSHMTMRHLELSKTSWSDDYDSFRRLLTTDKALGNAIMRGLKEELVLFKLQVQS